MSDNFSINGNLICGSAASGKTTLFAAFIRKKIEAGLNMKLCVAAAYETPILKLKERLPENHLFYFINHLDNLEFELLAIINEIEIAQNSHTPFFLAIDEPGFFYASETELKMLSEKIVDINKNKQIPFYLLTTTHTLEGFSKLFGELVTQNFSDYTVINSLFQENFFSNLGIITKTISPHTAYHLHKKNKQYELTSFKF